MSDQSDGYPLLWSGSNPFMQIPENPGIMWILIVLVAGLTIGVAVFSITHGIENLYQYLFLLPIVMTAYFFPRYGIAASVVMGLSLVLINLVFLGDNLSILSLAFFTFAVFLGIGGIITMLSENISGHLLSSRQRPLLSNLCIAPFVRKDRKRSGVLARLLK